MAALDKLEKSKKNTVPRNFALQLRHEGIWEALSEKSKASTAITTLFDFLSKFENPDEGVSKILKMTIEIDAANASANAETPK